MPVNRGAIKRPPVRATPCDNSWTGRRYSWCSLTPNQCQMPQKFGVNSVSRTLLWLFFVHACIIELKTTLFKTEIKAEEPITSTDLSVNPRTVRNRLHDAGRHHRTPACKEELNERHVRERLSFCYQHRWAFSVSGMKHTIITPICHFAYMRQKPHCHLQHAENTTWTIGGTSSSLMRRPFGQIVMAGSIAGGQMERYTTSATWIQPTIKVM